MLLPANTRRHVLSALQASPSVLRHLVSSLPERSPGWDSSEGDRFTCREVVAHLADWDVVFTARLRLTLENDQPLVEDASAEARSASEGYASRSLDEWAGLFEERRQSLLRMLEALDEGGWDRRAQHPRHGLMSVEAQAVHVLGHDGHHLGYIARLLSPG